MSNIRSYIIYEIRESTPDFITKSGSIGANLVTFPDRQAINNQKNIPRRTMPGSDREGQLNRGVRRDSGESRLLLGNSDDGVGCQFPPLVSNGYRDIKIIR